MQSIWSQTVELEQRPFLHGSKARKVQTAVIGGGLAGILTAYFLEQRGVKTVVLEAGKIGGGQTKNTTAKITSQHNLIYDKLLRDFGEEQAGQYAAINEQAIRQYREIITAQKIDCDFEERPAYLYSRDQQDVSALEQEALAAQKLGIEASFTKETTLPFSVEGAVRFKGQAQFHPLKFLQAISKDLTVYEQTRVQKVEDHLIMTDRGMLEAEQIVFACHFPFINLPGFYFARMYQERSYVLALKEAALLDGMYLGVDTGGLSFHNYGDLLLLGGAGHRTGENSAGEKYTTLREKAKLLYPKSKETAHWSAQDCMTLDGVPYIGQFSSSSPNWYVATGFGKWGMTSSMVSAMLISDQITQVENPHSEVFSPLRFTPSASMKEFLTNSGQAVKGLTKQVFAPASEKLEALPNGHGGVVEHDGQKLGVYKDEQGRAFVVSIRCPHLGCQLEWNPDEKSWDCPCHGSRFDYKGNLIDNPAQENLENANHA